MKILITGADGQVGHCLTRQWQGRAEVSAVGRAELDITDREAVMRAAAAFRPDAVINAAAYTAVDKAESERETAFAVNCGGARHLAEAAAEHGALMLHLSTDYVFDGRLGRPYREDDAVAPQNVYGQSKLAGERAVAAACPRHIILRTAWVFGEKGGNFVKTMLRLGAERDRLGIVADQYGAPTYAGDIADALIRITEQLHSGRSQAFGIYHFSGSPYVSWFEFARAIFAQAAVQGILARTPELQAIAAADYPAPAARPANSRLDLHKIQTAFGIMPGDWQRALTDLPPYLPAPAAVKEPS
ncbi:dTDP-4-dehydrorhamnose reductase [Neisseria leonii]|uniref:dTDP-4-dehydrorhamnose reductase n=1 Tax=Neisseria leonii TaxID=2995413 RepID=UPI0030D2712F